MASDRPKRDSFVPSHVEAFSKSGLANMPRTFAFIDSRVWYGMGSAGTVRHDTAPVLIDIPHRSIPKVRLWATFFAERPTGKIRQCPSETLPYQVNQNKSINKVMYTDLVNVLGHLPEPVHVFLHNGKVFLLHFLLTIADLP